MSPDADSLSFTQSAQWEIVNYTPPPDDMPRTTGTTIATPEDMRKYPPSRPLIHQKPPAKPAN